MSIIIRLQNLPWTANAEDIRQFFRDLTIPEGGVHIVGGEHGDAFIVFGSDEDARLAMRKDGETIKDTKIKLLLSSRVEMQKVIEVAKQQALNPQNLMQTLVGATNAAAAATPAVPMSLLLQAIPALRNLTGLPAMSSLTGMPAAMSFAGVPTSTAMTTVTSVSDPRNNFANDANKMMPITVPKAPSIQLNAKKADNRRGGASRSRSRSRSTSPQRLRDAKNRGSVADRSRDRRWKRDRSRSRNRDKRSSRSRSPVDKYRKRNRSHERRSSRSDTKYDSWSNETQSSDNRRNESAGNAMMSPKEAKKQDSDSRFPNRLSAAANTTAAAANFTNSYASESSSTNLGGGATKLNNELSTNLAQAAKLWPPNVPQPPTIPWMNDKLLANSGVVMDSQKALKDMMDGAAKTNVPPMGMFPFVPAGMAPPPAPGMFPFGGMPQVPPQAATALATTLPNNFPLPPMPPSNFGQFQGALHPPPQANMSSNVNVNKPQPTNRAQSPELDENEVDCFGRMRRKHHDRNESFSPEPSNARFDGDRPYGGRRDNRAPRDGAFKRDFAHAHGNYQNDESRPNYRSHDDFARRGGGGGGGGQYRRNFDRRDSDDEKRGGDGSRGGNGGGGNFRTGYDADRRNGFRNSNNNDDRRELPPRAGYSVNNANGSTCVELRNVPSDAVEDDIKKFFAPIPLYDSCIKFAPCVEEGARTRTVLIKFFNVNQRLDALKYRGRSINGCRVRVYESENDVWESTESVPVGQLRQPYVKISFIPKRAVKEDVLSALPVEPVDFVITKPRNRASLTAYLKFASIEPVEQVLSNKHKIYICEGRVKLETIDEEQFNESKKVIEEETAEDEETTTADAAAAKQRRFEDEEQHSDGRRLSTEEPPSRTYCVLVKNLPADVTDDDIADLLAGANAYPSRIHTSFESNGDEQTGEAFCEFSKECGAENALTKNGCVFRGQTITVLSVPEDEVRSAPGSWSNNHRSGGFTRQRSGPYSARGTFKSRGFHKRQTTRLSDRRRDLPQAPNLESFGKPGCVVALENVPYKADVEDILELFEDYNITRENVIRRFNDKGLPTGDARVSLESPSEALRAISELDGRKILNRNIYVKVVM